MRIEVKTISSAIPICSRSTLQAPFPFIEDCGPLSCGPGDQAYGSSLSSSLSHCRIYAGYRNPASANRRIYPTSFESRHGPVASTSNRVLHAGSGRVGDSDLDGRIAAGGQSDAGGSANGRWQVANGQEPWASGPLPPSGSINPQLAPSGRECQLGGHVPALVPKGGDLAAGQRGDRPVLDAHTMLNRSGTGGFHKYSSSS